MSPELLNKCVAGAFTGTMLLEGLESSRAITSEVRELAPY